MNIRTPYFATCYQGKLDHSQDISFPLIIKPDALKMDLWASTRARSWEA